MPKVEPEAGVQFTVTDPSTRSFPEAVKLTVVPDEPAASVVLLEGRVNEGGVVSTTVTVKLPLAVLPRASDAEQFTVVAPIGNVAPEMGRQVTAVAPSTRSDAEAENVTTLPPAPVASAVMFPGSVSAGGVES